jgi:hypothetical protein
VSIVTIAEEYKRNCDELAVEMSRPMRGSFDMGIVQFLMSLHSFLMHEFSDASRDREIQEQLMLREISLSVGLLMPKATSALSDAVHRERSMFIHMDFDEFGSAADDLKQISNDLSEALSLKTLPKIDRALLFAIHEVTSIIWQELERQRAPSPAIM